MGFRLTGTRRALFSAIQAASKVEEVSKGYPAVYVGEKMNRFVIPIPYLSQTLFQELLNEGVQEFRYNRPMGGLTIPCRDNVFLDLTSRLNGL